MSKEFVPSDISFQEAATYGLAGRVVWALANLGRQPTVQRVYQKAQDPGSKTRDTGEEFQKACLSLQAEGIIELVPPNCIRLRIKSPTACVAVRCTYCRVTAPPAKTREEAWENAIAAGYVKTSETEILCPSHYRDRYLIPGGPQQGPLSRGTRRRQTKEARRAARRLEMPSTTKEAASGTVL